MAGGTHPAQWLPDPTGKHQQRYWNGNRWTEHVADDLEHRRRLAADCSAAFCAATAGGVTSTERSSYVLSRVVSAVLADQ